MWSCKVAQQHRIVEVSICDSSKFNNVQGAVSLFLQSTCATASTWYKPSPWQAAGRSASKKWSYRATWHSLADTILRHSPSSLNILWIYFHDKCTEKKPRKWIGRSRWAIQWGDKNSNSLYCQYLVHALTGWVIKTISPQETLLFTYCTSSPFTLV